jgi:uncharacterized membrane protein YdjX (TVP38/TMEM64 family)
LIEWIESAIAAFESLGPIGYVLFVLAYILGALLLLPEAIFTIMAGALFGTLVGSAIAWGSAIVAAFLAFFLTRLVLRERVERYVERKSEWLRAVNRQLPKEGWKVVALARVSPLFPFGLQNYLFGMTKVRRRDYLFATAIGILPGTIVYAFLGATGRALLGGNASGWTWAMLAAGLVATVALSLLVGRLAKKRLGIDGRWR